ncbi:MAG: DUF4260 domain-containing protein [Sphingomonadaceae bacterium]|nr:DUF4260 domain-containing protein [Sphingomonadaceae bacterium]
MPATTYDRFETPARAEPSRLAPASAGGPATGPVAATLRLEGAVALTAAVLAYRGTGGSWALFAGLFLLPDLTMLGYLANRRVGAAVYNAGHTYLTPATLALAGWATGVPGLLGPALIWAAHIGFDRLMGYGLKYSTAFGATHLGWRGKREGASRGR